MKVINMSLAQIHQQNRSSFNSPVNVFCLDGVMLI